ncbi:MAG: VWA domain-containing protein [Pyrinomonadaceae bacterium]|nr:VWA domain-containing protein [Pyrinomonadaceae bacterium]
MSKIVVSFVLLCLCAASFQPVCAQTRPRRVGQTAGTSSASAPSASTNPPAPSRSTQRANAPQQKQTPTTSDSVQQVEEVGEDDVVRVNTTLVTVPVSVMDRNGKYIPNLRQEEFHIYEDNVEQQVAYFAAVDKPFTVALMIDTSRSTRFRLEDIQDAAIAFVEQLRPEDRVLVVSFDEDIEVHTEATNDRNELRRAIRRTRTGGSTRLYDAVDMVFNQRFNRIPGRKAIVLFTDGVDTTSRRADYASNIRDAEELDALVYPIQYDTFGDMRQDDQIQQWPFPRRPGIRIPNWPFPFPVPGRRQRWPWPLTNNGSNSSSVPFGVFGAAQQGRSRDEYKRAEAYLRDLAEKTGARLHRADDLRNLTQAFALIAEELRRQYSLGYYPKTPAQVGQRRQIRVRVNQPNLAVRSRDSYIYNSSTGHATATQESAQPPSQPVLRKQRLAKAQ